MRTAIVLSILLISCSLAPEVSMNINAKAQSQLQSAPRKIGIAILGQSNVGAFNQSGECLGVYAWNNTTNKYAKSVSYAAFGNSSTGFSLELARALKAKYPNDSLYITRDWRSSTGLRNTGNNWDWSPQNVSTRSLFRRACGELDLSLVGMDKKVLIWVQGETDASNLTSANQYQVNEVNFVDSLVNRYAFDLVIDYKVSPILPQPYRNTVNAAKDFNNYNTFQLDSVDYDIDKTHIKRASFPKVATIITSKINF